MSLLHRCGGILAHSSLQNCFNSATLEGFRAWMDCLRSCHSISIRFTVSPELEVTNWRPDILLQDFLIECRIHGSINYGKSSRSWSCKAAPDHHTTTTMFDCWYDVLFMECCVGFTPDVTGHTFQKVHILSYQSTEYLPESLGDNQDIFWQMWDEPFCSFWSAMAFALELSYVVFAQYLSYCWIMNTDLNWGKWGLQFFRCCSGVFYDLLDESSLRSWSNFGRPATPEKVHHCSKFSLFVDNGSDHAQRPKALEMAL